MLFLEGHKLKTNKKTFERKSSKAIYLRIKIMLSDKCLYEKPVYGDLMQISSEISDHLEAIVTTSTDISLIR